LRARCGCCGRQRRKVGWRNVGEARETGAIISTELGSTRTWRDLVFRLRPASGQWTLCQDRFAYLGRGGFPKRGAVVEQPDDLLQLRLGRRFAARAPFYRLRRPIRNRGTRN
jgi:hypothetical protein